MIKLLTLSSLILILMSSTTASAWELQTKLKESNKVSASELTFSADKTKVIYTPQNPPLGLVFENKITLEKTEYFVTGWAHGGSTIMFRVFAPDTHKNKPLCEEISVSEEASLRLLGKVLEISVIEEDGDKEKWVPCGSKK